MPTRAWRLLHVLALCTLAITQPLLGILGDNPTFFTAHGSSPAQLTWFALAVALAPAALLGIAEAIVHAVTPRLDDRVHLAIVAVLVFLVAIQVVDVLPGPWLVPLIVAVAISGGLAVLYATNTAVRSAVSLLAATPVLFVGLFLVVSPASELVFPDDVDAVGLSDLVSEDSFTASGGVTDDGAEPVGATLADRINERFPPVYLLVLDELPVASLLDETGEIDRARWPNFARLADTSHFFSNATTVGFTTERAVPAILTGRYETEAAPVYSLYPENLFTLLGDAYDISASDPLVDLCPPSVCNGTPPASMLELMASEGDPPDTPTPVPTTTTEPALADNTLLADTLYDEPGATAGSSFRSLVDDAMIVFGHLATPEGLDIGLPEIGATWGDFGGDLGADDPPTAAGPTTSPTTAPTAPTATDPADDTAPIEIGPSLVPDGDLVEVDAGAINEENRTILDRLITDDSRVADFRADIAAIAPSDVPRLHYLHVLLPHVPWRLHGNGDTYADVVLPGYSSFWDDDPTIARAGRQRHLLQLQFVDRLLGEYLDRLERTGIYDDATIVVVADHGISFVPGTSARGITEENVVGVAGVPLFYKLPRQRAGVHHLEPVETTDIVPTIARQLEIDIPWDIDGVDLFGPLPERDRLVHNTFSTWIPEPFPPMIAALTADLLDTFGNGTEGSLYGLAGLHDRIGDPIGDLVDEPAGYCWTRDRPATIPERDGEIGLVDGRLSTTRTEPIPFAVTIGDTLTGTAVSLDHEVRHRVFALGDPELWSGAAVGDIGLHEIDNGRLRPIPEC